MAHVFRRPFDYALRAPRPRLPSKVAANNYVLTADAGTFTLTGTAAAVKKGYRLSAASASFSLSGSAANLERATEYPCRVVCSRRYRRSLKRAYLTAESGSFAGRNAGGPETRREVSAEAGAFALSGADVAFLGSPPQAKQASPLRNRRRRTYGLSAERII